MELLKFELPPLNYPEVAVLTQFDLGLPAEKLEEILALPSATLVQDLETLVRHGLDLLKNEDFDEVDDYFVFHSLMLLGHLKSEQSLPLVLDIFRLPEGDIDFLFGDMFLEDVWQVPLLCGLNQLDKLADFVRDDTVDWEFSRANVVDALAQIGFHFPERKEEVLGHVSRLLHHFNDLVAFDEERTAYLVSTLADAAANFDARELLPVIEELFEKERIDHMTRGDWEEFQQEWGDLYDAKRRLYLDVREWYKTEGAKWLAMFRENDLEALRLELEQEQLERRKEIRALQESMTKQHLLQTGETKLGRNDPCPCGSGKKYKKCHGG